jgi:hypothetical protein
MKSVGKPDAGNPHVRFDERGRETGDWQSLKAPRPASTLQDSFGGFVGFQEITIDPNQDVDFSKFFRLSEGSNKFRRAPEPVGVCGAT